MAYKSVDAHVNVVGLREFQKEIKRLATDGDPKGLDQFKDANYEVGRYVRGKALVAAGSKGKMARHAANDLAAVRSAPAALLRANTDKDFPFFGGAEFGAKHNLRRLVKARVVHPGRPKKNGQLGQGRKGSRSRATVVRDGEDVGKVQRRVEAQYATKSGKTVSPREAGARQVKVARRANGGLVVIKGWNQFKPWKGNGHQAGYWLMPTIRENIENIGEMYQDELEKIMKPAFPE